MATFSELIKTLAISDATTPTIKTEPKQEVESEQAEQVNEVLRKKGEPMTAYIIRFLKKNPQIKTVTSEQIAQWSGESLSVKQVYDALRNIAIAAPVCLKRQKDGAWEVNYSNLLERKVFMGSRGRVHSIKEDRCSWCVNFKCPPPLAHRIEAEATRSGRTLSAVTSQAAMLFISRGTGFIEKEKMLDAWAKEPRIYKTYNLGKQIFEKMAEEVNVECSQYLSYGDWLLTALTWYFLEWVDKGLDNPTEKETLKDSEEKPPVVATPSFTPELTDPVPDADFESAVQRFATLLIKYVRNAKISENEALEQLSQLIEEPQKEGGASTPPVALTEPPAQISAPLEYPETVARQKRIALGFRSVRDLANAARVEQNRYMKWERGDGDFVLKPYELTKVATALNVTIPIIADPEGHPLFV